MAAVLGSIARRGSEGEARGKRDERERDAHAGAALMEKERGTELFAAIFFRVRIREILTYFHSRKESPGKDLRCEGLRGKGRGVGKGRRGGTRTKVEGGAKRCALWFLCFPRRFSSIFKQFGVVFEEFHAEKAGERGEKRGVGRVPSEFFVVLESILSVVPSFVSNSLGPN